MRADFNLRREKKNTLVCGRVSSPTTYFHFHSHIEIYYVISGKIEMIINERQRVLTAGEVAIAFSYDAHGYRKLCDSEAIYLIIPTDYCSEFLPYINAKRTDFPFISDRDTVKVVSAALEALLLEESEISKKGYVYVILGAILEKLPTIEGQASYSNESFTNILIYISNHFREDISLSDTAKEFGYNSSYVSRAFRDTFGISFIKYVTLLRLRESLRLLRTEKMSITECAMESGFGSMRSFYRAFREEFGVSPKDYVKTEQTQHK